MADSFIYVVASRAKLAHLDMIRFDRIWKLIRNTKNGRVFINNLCRQLLALSAVVALYLPA